MRGSFADRLGEEADAAHADRTRRYALTDEQAEVLAQEHEARRMVDWATSVLYAMGKLVWSDAVKGWVIRL